MVTNHIAAWLLVIGALASPPLIATDLPAAKRSTPVDRGDIAHDFTLVDQDGRKHTLSAERGKRPVVLVFYRGYW